MILEAGLIASRFVHYVAVLSLFGAALFPLYACGTLRSRPSIRVALFVWLRGVLLLSTFVSLVSLVGWFAFVVGTMAGDIAGVVDPKVLLSVVRATDFGPLWIVRLVLAIGAAVVLSRWPSPSALWLLPLSAMLLLASLAGTGHARVAEGGAGMLHVAVDAAHLIAAGVWIGGLWPLLFAMSINDMPDDRDEIAISEVLLRFSSVGYVAVATLVASGLVNSWFLVGSLNALLSSTYGWLLIAKVTAFLLMAMLAAMNRFWITPHVAQATSSSGGNNWLRRLRRHVVIEQALGLFVLAVVSFLGTIEPPVPA